MNNHYPMPLLDQFIPFDPAADFEAFLESIPAKWVVYLLSDEQGRPFQLLSVKNLRASLANRLTEHPADEKTRSIPYRQVVRQVAYRRVDSTLEAEWVYAQLARELFPDAYQKMLANWAPWYIAIDPEADFPRPPRWLITDQPDPSLLATTFGPITTKAAAQTLVETIEDAFDLCRYYQILCQAPHGQACAYKQMHKCPAPCDGSVSLEMYHQQIAMSLAALRSEDPAAAHEPRMRQAAAALEFELAGKIKAHMQQLGSLKAAGMSLDRLRFLALCRGGKAKAFKLMLLTPERIELSAEWSKPEELTAILASWFPDALPLMPAPAHAPAHAPLPAPAARVEHACFHDHLTFISRHVLLESSDSILLTSADPAMALAATARLARRKVEAVCADEGIVQEAR